MDTTWPVPVCSGSLTEVAVAFSSGILVVCSVISLVSAEIAVVVVPIAVVSASRPLLNRYRGNIVSSNVNIKATIKTPWIKQSQRKWYI